MGQQNKKVCATRDAFIDLLSDAVPMAYFPFIPPSLDALFLKCLSDSLSKFFVFAGVAEEGMWPSLLAV